MRTVFLLQRFAVHQQSIANAYNGLTNCLTNINPMTQTIAVKVRFSLLRARAKEKSWVDGSG